MYLSTRIPSYPSGVYDGFFGVRTCFIAIFIIRTKTNSNEMVKTFEASKWLSINLCQVLLYQ